MFTNSWFWNESFDAMMQSFREWLEKKQLTEAPVCDWKYVVKAGEHSGYFFMHVVYKTKPA